MSKLHCTLHNRVARGAQGRAAGAAGESTLGRSNPALNKEIRNGSSWALDIHACAVMCESRTLPGCATFRLPGGR